MDVFTIGFTQKTAEQFFGLIIKAKIQRLIDVRLNNSSQLAGFSKRDDLRYFLKEICHCEYVHEPLFAPTQAILDRYKKAKGDWMNYEKEFLKLLADRKVETKIDRSTFAVRTILLCSEPTAEHCHRRLVLHYLNEKWGDVSVNNL